MVEDLMKKLASFAGNFCKWDSRFGGTGEEWALHIHSKGNPKKS